jgi:serine/threonine protein kinase
MNRSTPSVETILAQAVEIAGAAERQAFVEQACGGDPELKRRVERLIGNHFRAGSFLERPAVAMHPDGAAGWEPAASADGPGTVIGPYKLLEQIGEGGMGVVYMAEQTQPMRRKVALKIIKPGMDTKQVIARFEAERQALALMDHPNIARVLDAGTTTSGRPYFVMELVRGIPITDYCDRYRLAIDDRLELFVQACQAVQHAHQKGIIHRDLKPSNVMVTMIDGGAVPKVIDFGVAKAMGQQLTEKTLFTGFAQLLGTPLYMSPEQAEFSGADVDTRSDIYALGVLLYELLTGTTPFDAETFRTAGYDEMRRIIREQEPPRPSTRISTLEATSTTISANRQTEPGRLRKALKGELDWIVMKALEKDRNRRYESASALAADVQRYLSDEPVQACPPSNVYRLRKFAHKHQAALATVGAFAALVFVASVVSTVLMVRALSAERLAKERGGDLGRANAATAQALAQARAEADKANAINEFLVNDLLVQADPEKNAVSDRVTVREVLDRAADRIGPRFRNQPLLEAALHTTIATIYDNLEVRDKRREHFAAALAIYEREKGSGAAETAKAMIKLGVALEEEDRYAEAEPLIRQALDTLYRVLGEEHPDTLAAMINLAVLWDHSDRSAEAERLMVKILDASRRVLGEEHPTTLEAMSLLAAFYSDDRTAMALPLFAKVVEVSRRVLGEENPGTLVDMNNLASTYRLLGKLPEAEHLLVKVVPGMRRVLGEEHRDTLITMRSLGKVYLAQGRLAEAEPLLLSSYEGMRARDQNIPTRVERYLTPLAKEIVHLYDAWGKPEKAAAWKARLGLTDLPADVFARP